MSRSRQVGGGGGDRESGPHPLENHKWLYVSLEILVGTPLEKQLDPVGPFTSRGRFLRPSATYGDNSIICCHNPHDEIFWNCHVGGLRCCYCSG